MHSIRLQLIVLQYFRIPLASTIVTINEMVTTFQLGWTCRKMVSIWLAWPKFDPIQKTMLAYWPTQSKYPTFIQQPLDGPARFSKLLLHLFQYGRSISNAYQWCGPNSVKNALGAAKREYQFHNWRPHCTCKYQSVELYFKCVCCCLLRYLTILFCANSWCWSIDREKTTRCAS